MDVLAMLRFVLLLATIGGTYGMVTYRAAVYEHAVIPPHVPAISRHMALAQMMHNLRMYEIKAMKAGMQKVDILVFPEDGLYGWHLRHRMKIRPYLEPIPDPKHVAWNPCNKPMAFPQNEVQVFLSCLAKRNKLYIVANMGDIQKCFVGIDPNCPPDGFYQYNTNVAYDRKGNFIARYHKQNRYFEPQFNAPTHPEYIWFDTKFGRFGLITCNDIMFFDPVMELIRDHNVSDIVFPAAWPDTPPIYMSVPYMSSFAVGQSVNLLGAGLKEPKLMTSSLHGSGLFTPMGAIKYVHDTKTPHGHLVIGDVPVNIRKAAKLPSDMNPIQFGPANMKAIVPVVEEFKSKFHKNWMTFAYVKGTKGMMTVCNNGFCCYLDYQKEFGYEKYALGAYSGLHKAYGPIYTQVCVLMKCLNKHPHSCGQPVFSAHTRFDFFHMKGNFSSPFIQPQIVLSAPNYNFAIAPKGSFQYGPFGLKGSARKEPLIHAALVGRVYRKDCLTALGG